jgi:N-glycosidase YbiA
MNQPPILLSGNHPLLNFYGAGMYLPTPLDLAGMRFASVEHWFQANKAWFMTQPTEGVVATRTVSEAFGWIADSATPRIAKQRGREIQIDVATWNRAAYGYMFQGQFAKFFQHSHLRAMLIETGDAELIENRRDPIWGHPGKNMCGKSLMQVRRIFLEHAQGYR